MSEVQESDELLDPEVDAEPVDDEVPVREETEDEESESADE